jgi:nucleotide sugar dehydrogenase
MPERGRPTAAVVGLGKIGLPLAAQIAGSGWQVIGLDVDADVVAGVNRGAAPFPGEPGLDEALAALASSGRLTATTSARDAVSPASVVVVVVPLVVDSAGAPQFTALDAATEAIGASLGPGTLVVYETTLPVGTTRQRLAPLLVERSGRVIGRDVFVCFSPERVSSGSVFVDLRRYPKIVGGLDDESLRRGVGFYEDVLTFDARTDLQRPNGVWPVGPAEAAELAKLAETTYRDINIAFANELAMAADEIGVDVMAVIEACNSQPFSHIHRPGIAVGGHCIPVYPHLLRSSTSAGRVAGVARSVNEGMPAYGVALLETRLGLAGRRVAVLGLAYRGGVKETFHSGTWTLVRLIEEDRNSGV